MKKDGECPREAKEAPSTIVLPVQVDSASSSASGVAGEAPQAGRSMLCICPSVPFQKLILTDGLPAPRPHRQLNLLETLLLPVSERLNPQQRLVTGLRKSQAFSSSSWAKHAHFQGTHFPELSGSTALRSHSNLNFQQQEIEISISNFLE